MNIHVSNLSLNIIDSDLKKLFAAYGEVNSAVIIRDRLNGRSKGTAIIDMVNDSQGRQAIQCLDQTIIDGKPITVSEIRYSIRDYKN
jgi:RNA recognition motif-containing protein